MLMIIIGILTQILDSSCLVLQFTDLHETEICINKAIANKTKLVEYIAEPVAIDIIQNYAQRIEKLKIVKKNQSDTFCKEVYKILLCFLSTGSNNMLFLKSTYKNAKISYVFSSSKDYEYSVNLYECLTRKDRFMLDYKEENNLNIQDIKDYNSWIEYMKYFDPQNNIFELFIRRFRYELKEENFSGPIFKKLLYAHNRKWRQEETNIRNLPSSLKPVVDDFAELRDFGFVSYGGDLKGNFAICKYGNQEILNLLRPIAEGELTEENYSLLKTLPEQIIDLRKSIYGKTWLNIGHSTNIPLNLFELVSDYFEKCTNEDKHEPFSYTKKKLALKDTYTEEIRKLIVKLSSERPSEKEIYKMQSLVEKNGWERE